MSSRQKVYSGAEAVEKFKRAGWPIARQPLQGLPSLPALTIPVFINPTPIENHRKVRLANKSITTLKSQKSINNFLKEATY